MAYQGPAYGLSRECQLKAQAKFSMQQAREALEWVREVTQLPIITSNGEKGLLDAFDFAETLKDGTVLCTLINILCPGSVTKINNSKAPFKQRENLEMFLKGCEKFGLKNHDLFQVNDLYERKNLYMVVNCLFALGGLAQKKGYKGAFIGVKVSNENKRGFSKEILDKSKAVIGLQAGNNKGASQSGMTPYGMTRQIKPDGR